MSKRNHAFTLIELLVVISIIALLASLVVYLIHTVQFNAKKLVTIQRLDAVTQGLAQIGANQGSVAYVMTRQWTSSDPYVPHGTQSVQSGWPHYEGVMTFDTSGQYPPPPAAAVVTNPDPFPLVNLSAVPPVNEGQWFVEMPPMMNYQTGTPSLDYDDHLFNYPWGKSPFSITGAVTATSAPIPPEHHILRNLCPYQTMNLLVAANILLDDPYTDASSAGQYVAGDQFEDISGSGVYQYASDLYTTDRRTKEPWNDKWGNPIVVAYGIFQPQPFPTGTGNNEGGPQGPNPYATQSLQVYQYARSFYISVAAAGPIVRNITPANLVSTSMSTWIDTPPAASPGATIQQWQPSPAWDNTNFGTSAQSGGNLYLIWKQANQICQQPLGTDPTSQPELRSWCETSFDDPPWLGTKWGYRMVNGHQENCFLTAPQEMK
jgi:prepilin-type N-terminal cleavage/methylation domain-containing protein